jgi:hypothetical protein
MTSALEMMLTIEYGVAILLYTLKPSRSAAGQTARMWSAITHLSGGAATPIQQRGSLDTVIANW